MPINFDRLTLIRLNECVIIDADLTLQEVRDQLPAVRDERLYKFIIVPLPDGHYITARWCEIEEIVYRLLPYGDPRTLTVEELAQVTLPVGYTEPADHVASKLAEIPLERLLQNLTPTVGMDDQATTTHEAQTARDRHPGGRIVVLADGAIHGLLFRELLASGERTTDPFDVPRPVPRMASAMPDEAASLAESEVAPPTSALLSEVAKTTAQDDRVFNLWVEQRLVKEAEIVGGGQTLTRVVPPGTPLALGGMYTVNVNVAPPLASAQAAAGSASKAEELTAAAQIEVDVRLTVDSAFFKLYGFPTQKVIFPRGGNSKNIASFTIEPLKQGVGEVTALLSINNKPFQKIVVQLAVGDAALAELRGEPVRASGMTLAAAVTASGGPLAYPAETDASLTIIRETTGYTFMLHVGSGFTVARLNLGEREVADAVRKAREDFLEKVVRRIDPSRNVYAYQQKDTTIPAPVHQEVLKDLRQIGDRLFRALFFAPGSGDQGKAMGQLLRQVTRERELRIRVIAERFAFPWSLIYALSYRPSDPVDPMGFWGYRHIIEYTPQFSATQPAAFAPEIQVADRLQLGFVFDETIDTQFGAPIISEQRQILPGIGDLAISEYDTRDEFLDLLSGSTHTPQIIYFYGHAISRQPGEKDPDTGMEYGPGDSYLTVNGEVITLDEMNMTAGLDLAHFDSAPLVVLNACESAELSPELYNGLMPYLVGRGARGVIGTEVLMPAHFAAEFAPALLRRFASGGIRLGDLLRDMRREYLRDKNNVLPLIYALYSNSELIVKRG
ncbi:MAG: CHAT domain-containing protein [Chloroflexi bacterium]|nr:CHAT domain-containing protein [Chloroflexota bacterium]